MTISRNYLAAVIAASCAACAQVPAEVNAPTPLRPVADASSESTGLHCGPRAQVVESLANQGARTEGAGISGYGDHLFEIWRGPGVWSILRTDTAGRACEMTGGEDWIDRRDKERST